MRNALFPSLAALVCGLLFGAGLALSGMINPQKILAFLDVLGLWDPSLAFVMAGAVLPMFIVWQVVQRRTRPVLADKFDLPIHKAVDKPLILGSLLFGIGWGLTGYCPGPAFAALPFGGMETGLFVLSIAVGMILYQKFLANS